MFFDHELYFLQQLLTRCHLQNQIIQADEPLNNSSNGGLSMLFGQDAEAKRFCDYFPEVNERTVYRLTDMFLCKYIFLRLPTPDGKDILIIGPYLNVDISNQQILEQGEKMKIPPKQLDLLKTFYSSLPIIREESYIFTMVNTFAEYLWGDAKSFASRDISSSNPAAIAAWELEGSSLSNDGMLSINTMENRYNYENELMLAVSQGNLHKAEAFLSGFSSLALESRVPDRLRNTKNYCIILNTLLRKAAENGGVHPVHLDSVSSDFAKRIESSNSVSAIPELMREMPKTYCNLVRRHSIKNFSPLVQKAMVRIQNDLTGDLSLSTMAKLSNVSPSYLSSLFKKETGLTLTRYVNEKRVSLAKHLLKTTTLQVQTIAQHCGILDLHYFCRIFKGIVGKTPTEYRDSLSFE